MVKHMDKEVKKDEIKDLELRATILRKKIDRLENMLHLLKGFDEIYEEIESLKYDVNYNDYSLESAYNGAIDDVLKIFDDLDKFF